MKSKCIAKVGHSCGSSDALQLFENDDKTITGFCFSCNTYVPNPEGINSIDDIPQQFKVKKTNEQIREEIDEISECATFDLPTRKLRGDTLAAFGVKVGVSTSDGKTPTIVYFPYTKDGKIVRYKARLIQEKRMWNIALSNDVDLFGWEQAASSGAKTLVITEGEFDAVAGQRIMEMSGKQEYRDHWPVFVSLPNGASGAAKDLAKVSAKIRQRFPEIKFMFDSDEQGKKAVEDCMKIFPNATSITLPCKDANECLIKGKVKEAHNAIVWRAEKPKNTRILRGSELEALARVRPSEGIAWPWDGLTKLTRGIRRGETYYFGAGVKMGKSELVNQLGKHLMVDQGLNVMYIKPEEDKAKTYQMLVAKAAGKIFHDPNVEFDHEAFDAASKLIGDKALILDAYQFVNWDTLKDDIRYCVHNEDVKDIIIDPITCFTNEMSASDANEFLVGMSAEFAAMAKDLDFTGYIFCHLKAPTNGPPHERGGEVLSTQFTGSRAMMRSCHMMIGLEGNKDPELDPMERNMRKLKLLEDRTFGATGVVKLFWDSKTSLFNEVKL